MRNIFQYQGKVEPLEPTLNVIPEMDSWFMPASEPSKIPLQLVNEGYYVEPLDDSNFLVDVPSMDSWFRPASEPLFIKESLVNEGLWVGVLEPTLFIVPEFPDWWQQTNEPVRVKPTLVNEGWFALDYNEIIVAVPVPAMDSWFRPASEPTLPLEPLNTGSYVSTLEPTLFVVPEFDWEQPTNEPIIPLKQPQPFVFDFPWETILAIEVIFDWWVQANEPIIQKQFLILDTSIDVFEQSIIADSKFPDWFVLAQTPIIPLPVNLGYEVKPLEPTLFVIPTLDTWFKQAEEPTLPRQPLVNEGIWVGVLEPSLFAIIISGPFKIRTQQTYLAGAITGQGYTAGAIKSQQYGAGPQTQDGDC